MVSVVVPCFDEKENIIPLFAGIQKSLLPYCEFEVIFVDDKSTDGTWELLQELEQKFPVTAVRKVGKRGKAFSLLQGFELAKYDILAMMDADLQYPPEAILQMMLKLSDADLVVAERKESSAALLRKISGKTFRFVFGKAMFGFNVDVQSGLKVFTKEVFDRVKFKPKSPWTFDLEFLKLAREAGFKIGSYDINFVSRQNGASKVNLAKSTIELSLASIGLRLRKIKPIPFLPPVAGSMKGAGVGFRGKKYTTHTTLAPDKSALENFVLWQKLFIFGLIGVFIFGLVKATLFTLALVVGILSVVYFIDVLFNFFLIVKSLHTSKTISVKDTEIEALKDKDLPVYTILCPLYREANILPQFLDSLDKLEWPKDKLDVILLLEEDDAQTLEAVSGTDLAAYISTLVVPYSMPKTKPKACNFGLAHAKGEFLVIYDAEDIPDPLQLKKAFVAFSKVPSDVVCLQAKLNYHNTDQNLLTRFFTAEYSLWFDVILMGLQSFRTSIPLGGTSNHFPTAELKKLQGWDPFNVTEDADLGVRLFKAGYKTAVIDSLTLEEANSNVSNWVRQRSRWLKGYMQTYLVHMRHPLKFVSESGPHAFIFHLLMGGKIAFMFINPILWIVTLLYFPLYAQIGPTINSLYPAPIFYMAITSLVFGNFLYIYYFMIGCAKREQWGLLKYVYLVPFYWLLGSYAAVIALWQLIFRPHFWEKTIHGLNLREKERKFSFGKVGDRKVVRPSVLPKPIFALPRFSFRKLLTPSLAPASVLIGATVAASFFNFVYNAYLARTVSLEDFGLVSLMGSFLFLTAIPSVALSRTVTNKTAYYLGRYHAVISDFWKVTRHRAIIVALATTLVWFVLIPFLSAYFRTDSMLAFLLFAPVWVIAAAAAVDEGFLSGNHRFEVIGAIVVSDAGFRLLFSFVLVTFGFAHLVYAAIPAALFVSFLIGWYFASRLKGNSLELKLKTSLDFPTKFLMTSIFAKISIVAFLSIDLILAKHFLSPEEAGRYAILSLSGKMIYFVGALFSQFITPIISRDEGRGVKNGQSFGGILALSVAASVSAYLAFGIFGSVTVPFLFGQKANSIVGYLPTYGLAILLFTIASSVVMFYQTKRKNIFPTVALALAGLEVVGIFLYNRTLEEFVSVMSVMGFASFVVVMAMHFASEKSEIVWRNFKDFLGLFTTQKRGFVAGSGNAMNILIFNWRDLRHVWAGGAEVYAHEIAKKLVANGHKVTIFCGNDGKSLPNETVDGVQIIRRGGFYMVYAWAFLYYVFKFRGKYDLVVDCENGIPFFTPLYVKEPVIGLIHHVHQEVFRTGLSLPFAKTAQFLEATLMPIVYKNKKIITVSESSKKDLRSLGFAGEVEIINPGIERGKFRPGPKTISPQIVYLGRLKPYKSVETLIYAMGKVALRFPNAKLKIAGSGESEGVLKDLVAKLGLGQFVQFLGKIGEREKVALLSSSWLAVQPSMMEGWGITAIEANASGTSIVAADVPGLRDSVLNPHTGFLVPWGNADKFALRICEILDNTPLRRRLEKDAVSWSRNFSWDKSANAFYLSVVSEVEKAASEKYLKDMAIAEGESV